MENRMAPVNRKIIEVKLRQGTHQTTEISPFLFNEYLGGYGIGVRLLMEKMNPAADALGPENILGFAPGYLTGTGFIGADRYMVFGKSPSTGGWGDANSGGYFGRRMKETGVDVILLSEISNTPVYLYLDESSVQLLDAASLWGMDCYETDDELKRIHGKDCEVACIGPAGENLSMIAGISTDKGRMAARSGLGAVMGSKRVKAIVVKGKKKTTVASPELFREKRQKMAKGLKNNPFAQGLSGRGTAMFYETCVNVGDAPIKNWAGTKADIKAPEAITEEVMETYRSKKYNCSSCVIGCGGHEKVESGPYKTATSVHKAEYESMALTGSNLLNDSAASLIKINDLCNRYGMDTIGCGGLCGYAIESFEKGFITGEHTAGLELTWGDTESIITLVEQIGRGEALGATLMKGFDHAISTFGEETADFAIAVRNEALPAHDPRWSAGLALTYYTDATPARHTQGSTTFPVGGYQQPEMTNDNLSGRAKYHIDNVNLTHALSCLGLCTFCLSIVDYRDVVETLRLADGNDWSEESFNKTGSRISVMRHLFNLKAGIHFKSFKFPERVLGNPPLAEGPTSNVKIDLDLLVNEYLDEVGYDHETLQPSELLLEELNISQFS